MRISKPFIKETHIELWTVTVECPYCGVIRNYRSLHSTVFDTKCKACKKHFVVDHDIDAWGVLQSGYRVIYIGTIKKYANLKGETVSSIFSDKKQRDIITVRLDNGIQKDVSVYDIEVDRELNKELWRPFEES